MASRRMVPTHFFKDPDIMNLSSKDTQLILIGLILAADDEGREVAHAGLLGREMDYPAEQIETALQDLVANDLLLLYQAGKHRYYQLTRWPQWQTLGGRFTPSRYPAPPVSPSGEDEAQGNVRGISGETVGNQRGNSPHFPDQENPRESNPREEEGEENAPPARGPAHTPGNVVSFPGPRASASANATGDGVSSGSHSPALPALIQQIAHILKLPVSEALSRLVAEYAPQTALSLLGEADAAREWIDDPRRNQRHKRMSPAFFRAWLKREQEAVARRQQSLQALAAAATGTTGTAGPAGERSSPFARSAAPRAPDLMRLAEEDAAHVARAARSPAGSTRSGMHAYPDTKGEEP